MIKYYGNSYFHFDREDYIIKGSLAAVSTCKAGTLYLVTLTWPLMRVTAGTDSSLQPSTCKHRYELLLPSFPNILSLIYSSHSKSVKLGMYTYNKSLKLQFTTIVSWHSFRPKFALKRSLLIAEKKLVRNKYKKKSHITRTPHMILVLSKGDFISIRKKE